MFLNMFPAGWARRQDRWALLVAALFMVAVAVVAIGSYRNRLAQVHSDNGAVFYAYLYTHAAEFRADPFGYPGLHWLWGSICFWAPVLASKYLGLDPRLPDYGFYLLQIVCLGLSVLILTWQASRSWLTAFASMGLAVAIQPWSWNLAAYGMPIDLPLYTSLALGLSVLAAAAFLADRSILAWLLALAAALVHPVIVCYLLVMLAAWAGLNRVRWRTWVTATAVIRLGLLLVLCGSPFLIGMGIHEPLLSPGEHWISVSKHMHSVPWGNTDLFRVLAIRALAFMLVAACFWQPLLALPRRQRDFLLAAAIGTAILGSAQIIGALLKIPDLALMMGLRAFSIFILLAWPFVFTALFSRKVLARLDTAFALLLLVFVWFRMADGIPFYNLALFALTLSWPQSFLSSRRLIYLAILAALPMALPAMDYHYARWLFFHTENVIDPGFYLEALLAALVLAELSAMPRILPGLRGLAAAGMLVMAFLRAEAVGAATRTPAAAALYDAERWAATHTPPGTLFLTNYGWRSVAQRPAFMLNPDLTEEVYTPFVSIRARNEVLFHLYGIADSWRSMGIQKINAASAAGYAQLGTSDFAQLARKYGASYLVRSSSEPALDFPVAYRNKFYRIYRVP